MHRIDAQVDLAALTREISSVPLVRMADGAGSSHFGGPEGWIKGLSNVRIDAYKYPVVAQAIQRLRVNVHVGLLVQVMVNRLEPGAELSPHRDGLPDLARFHLPVTTHPLAFWWDETLTDRYHMDAGYWHGPVPYCGILHMAGNPSPHDRVHVVADFKKGN